MKPANIELHIEELVLHGFAPGDRAAIADTLQFELQRLLQQQGVPAAWLQGGAVAHVTGLSLNIAPSTRGAAIGNQAAQALYQGFRQNQQASSTPRPTNTSTTWTNK